MVNRPKMKGTAAETAFVQYLRRSGFPHAERRTLKGRLDRGDVTGCPGLVFEVKDCSTWVVAGWLKETEQERVNDGADHGVLIMKPPGLGLADPGRWAAAAYLYEMSIMWSPGPFNNIVEISGKKLSALRTTFKHHPAGQMTLVKAQGIKDVNRFYAVCRVEDLLVRLRMRGYGTPLAEAPFDNPD